MRRSINNNIITQALLVHNLQILGKENRKIYKIFQSKIKSIPRIKDKYNMFIYSSFLDYGNR